MKKIIIFIQLLLLVAVTTSCSDDYLDVNTDPHHPTEVSPNLILPVAQVYTSNGLKGANRFNTFGNLMMYNWSQSDGFSWYDEEFNYSVTPSFYSGLWDFTFPNTLKQYHALQSFEGDEYGYYKAISSIMKAYHFQTLVDTYGDIPYTEALQRGVNILPKYDGAESVYDGLMVDLDNAIALINSTESVMGKLEPESDDIIFGGNMVSWKQLANTIKMRLLIRQSGMASKQTYIQNEFAKILTEGSGFLTEDASVNPGYHQEEKKQNPFWDSYGQSSGGDTAMNGDATCATDWILDYLVGLDDPRIDFLYEFPPTGHLGVPQGLDPYPSDDSLIPEFVSNIGPGLLRGPDQDAVFFPLSEALFLQAEAIERGYLGGDAKTAFEEAITASFNYLGATGAETYYANGNPLSDWASAPDKIEAIITQKFIALNGIDGHESWVEYNRTGFPLNLPISLMASTSDRPVRLYYPSSELSANGENVPAQKNAFTDKIFWAN